MANTNLAKTTYGLLGTGVLLGAGYVAKPWILGDRVVDLLKVHNPERQILTIASPSYSDRWKKAWFDYRESNKDRDKDAWEIGDWEKAKTNKNDVPAPSSFIDACERNSQARISGKSHPLYQEVLQWCTGSSKVSIRDLIRDSGKRSLNEHDSKTNEKNGWKPLFKKYFDNYKNQSTDPLGVEGWQIKESTVTAENSGMMEKFIEKCKSLAQTEVEGTGDPTYQKINSHCSADIHAEDIIREAYPGRRLVNVSKFKNKKDNPLALEIWQRYVSKNKEKTTGEDQWGVKSWHLAKERHEVPENFWDKCDEKRTQPIKGIEDAAFKEVFDYCTVEASKIGDWGDTV
ncbi:hypothetical protein A6V39_05145 [Candidatus Mycoplasma haematobovis]|uniref:Uncharacterized protein n=1 Tax=Candidatus Mycoplasma haematobovis TaxID=432608 RepID=A0A1A9QCJ6_9MOLU|nr:hypothetical protein [Candidatus Mycoplasma haematobovis]OAL09814.1 hypothetical protein A6V39_05145 [Candidatus Mycoplasma haematobovis]